jgi:hypothetical protein
VALYRILHSTAVASEGWAFRVKIRQNEDFPKRLRKGAEL